MTDYLWKDILTKLKLSRIIENYAQVVVEEDPETKKKSVKQIFPRYHQLNCVEKLLADVKENGIGKRYLIQHSAGSGKSNSISWLAHQLIGLEQDGHPMIDSVLVVTDRRILDKQIRDNIKQFMQVANTVAWAEHSGDLRKQSKTEANHYHKQLRSSLMSCRISVRPISRIVLLLSLTRLIPARVDVTLRR